MMIFAITFPLVIPKHPCNAIYGRLLCVQISYSTFVILFSRVIYRQVSNISRTLAGNKLVDHSDVGAAPITSSFST